jgi:integrase
MAWMEPKRKEDGPPYYVRWQEGKSKHRQGPFYDWDEARNARNEKDTEERNAKGKGGRPTGIASIEKLFESHIQEQIVDEDLAENTQTLKRNTGKKFFVFVPRLDALTAKKIDAFKLHLMTAPCQRGVPYSPSSISMMLRVIRTFVKWLFKKKYISEDVMLGYDIPKSRKRKDIVQSTKDKEILLNSAPDPLFRLFLTFCFYQGLRKMMIRLADFKDISKNGMWTIPAAHTKAKFDECVPLHHRVIEEIKSFYKEAPQSGRIFPGYYDTLIDLKWKITKRRANLPYHITIHGLRRTWATHFMAKTQNLDALMKAGAWRDVKTAMEYQHIAQEWLKKEVQKFDYD